MTIISDCRSRISTQLSCRPFSKGQLPFVGLLTYALADEWFTNQALPSQFPRDWLSSTSVDYRRLQRRYRPGFSPGSLVHSWGPTICAPRITTELFSYKSTRAVFMCFTLAMLWLFLFMQVWKTFQSKISPRPSKLLWVKNLSILFSLLSHHCFCCGELVNLLEPPLCLLPISHADQSLKDFLISSTLTGSPAWTMILISP